MTQSNPKSTLAAAYNTALDDAYNAALTAE